MKSKVSILIGPLLLWACSVDPHQGIPGEHPTDPSLQQGADATRENEEKQSGELVTGEGKETGTVVEVPAEVVPGTGPSPAPEQEKQPAPPVTVSPGQSTANNEEDETTVTPPHKITGAFLVGEVISTDDEDDQDKVYVGVIAKQDDLRLSEQPDRFNVVWGLSADPSLTGTVRLMPTKNPRYDRIMVFEGTLEELNAVSSQVAIQIAVSEKKDDTTKLESVVKTTVTDLFKTPAGAAVEE